MRADGLLLYGTIVVSIVSYAGAEWARFRGTMRYRPLARTLWTVGAAAIVAHAAVAFHFHHGWSHAAALDHVAVRTASVAGFAWGGGLFVNYAFVTLWMADAAWWWWSPDSYRTPSSRATHALTAFFLFMFFNAAIVFAAGATRILGIVAVLVVSWAWHGSRERNSP